MPRKIKTPTPEEEAYLYWFPCRVMGLAIRAGRHNVLMSILRTVYYANGRKFYERDAEDMADDIERLGNRLRKRIGEPHEYRRDFEL